MPAISSPVSAGQRDEIASAMLKRRHEIARRLLELMPRDASPLSPLTQVASSFQTLLERHLGCLVDYAVAAARTADPVYEALYCGELEKLIAGAQSPLPERRRPVDGAGDTLAAGFAKSVDILSAVLSPVLPDALRPSVRTLFDAIIEPYRQSVADSVKVLFVGDCLFTDILPFLQVKCRKQGIAVVPTFVTPKNQAAVRKMLLDLSHEHFDLVFFSPFTYAYSRELSQFQNIGGTRVSPDRRELLIDRALAETRRTIELLAERFDCRIYIHNTSGLIRHRRGLVARMVQRWTSSVREGVASAVDRWLRLLIDSQNRLTFRHLHLLDERALIRHGGGDRVGELLSGVAAPQRPSRAGIVLAEEYRKIISVHVRLMHRKLVICDLDNTLWNGVIGEGQVTHFEARQRVLKALRNRGILLAINAKNDPANVTFADGVLSDEDFVARRINWSPKVGNIADLHRELNLKPRNTVFIDDRADERYLARQGFPDMLVLDSNAADTWAELAHWAALIEPSLGIDRTRAYRERAERSEYLAEPQSDRLSHAEMLKGLGLQVGLRYAGVADLPRVVDLINSTNQWNLCGTRTSLREVTRYYVSEDCRIVVADARDNFGAMGTVCIAIVREEAQTLHIPVFVLSCRVFGYDIERAVLNFIKRSVAAELDASVVIGAYMATAANAPCKDMYRDNGFAQEGDAWVWKQGAVCTPAWLTISEQVGRVGSVPLI